MINFEDNALFLIELHNIFPVKDVTNVSPEILSQYDGEIVYDFFHGKSWYYLATHLDFISSNEALEKGCLYLSNEEFRYYFPLYIYASLINKQGWGFEYSFFLHYLTPGVINEGDYFNFVEQFTDIQRSLIYDFILYKYKNTNDLMAMDAFNCFWFLYS